MTTEALAVATQLLIHRALVGILKSLVARELQKGVVREEEAVDWVWSCLLLASECC